MSRFPFPIPDGWFQLAWSSELPARGVLPVRAFGKSLRLARTADGGLELHELAADGEPGPALPVRELHRMVFAFHHGAGAPPSWEIPAIPEASRDDWSEYETYSWEIRTHNQEIGENSVDRAHFRYVHGTAEIPDSELRIEGHLRFATQHVTYATPRGPVAGRIEVTAHGMGFTTTRFTGICETLLLISHTPIDAERVRSRFSFTLPRAVVGTNVGRALVREIVRQLEEDIPIWEHKRYLEAPLLCDGDGPIGPYRRWARQFYSGAIQEAAIGG